MNNITPPILGLSRPEITMIYSDATDISLITISNPLGIAVNNITSKKKIKSDSFTNIRAKTVCIIMN